MSAVKLQDGEVTYTTYYNLDRYVVTFSPCDNSSGYDIRLSKNGLWVAMPYGSSPTHCARHGIGIARKIVLQYLKLRKLL